MKVFVTGATGAVGRFVVPRLLAEGHDVTALARTDEKAAALAGQGVRPERSSLFDTEGLTVAFGGHDVVANLATSIPPTRQALRAAAWADNNRIRTEGSAAVVGAAIAAGVGRVVQESITFTYPDQGHRWIDEELPIEPTVGVRSTATAEQNTQRFTNAGGIGVVLRFGAFYGPGSAQSEQLVASARHHIGLVMGRPTGYISSIHLDDAAAAVLAGLHAPAGTYNVVDDDPLTKRDFAAALGAAVGKRPWIHVPGRAASLAGAPTEILTRSHRVASGRFRAATGWAPRYASAREGWPATLETMNKEMSSV